MAANQPRLTSEYPVPSMFRMRTVKIYVIHDEFVRSAIPVVPEPASRIRHENETKPFAPFVRHLQSPWSAHRRSPRSLRPYSAAAGPQYGTDHQEDAQAPRGGTLEHLDPTSLVSARTCANIRT
jgi:hypothetical protein